MRNRFAIMVFTVATSVLLGVTPALAMTPVHERWTFEATEQLPEEVCGFPVSLEVHGRQTLTVHLDHDGEPTGARSTGQIHLTFTRADTETHRAFSIPGPSVYDEEFELVAGTGPWFMFTDEGPSITRGRWTFEDGVFESSGMSVSVCERLA